MVTIVVVAVVLALVAAPLTLALVGWQRGAVENIPAPPRDWRPVAASATAYALAFNLIFLLQEIFLVVPKALTPGLRPTLFHNNHRWLGHHPLEALFQGTGACATLLAAVLCIAWLKTRRGSPTMRLLCVWLAYHGIFQALPQVVLGAVFPGNDVGMAMAYLNLGPIARTVAALTALVAMPIAATWLTRRLLEFAGPAERIDTARGRSRFVARWATLAAVLALPAIVACRVPGNPIETVAVPVVVMAAGIGWMQAGAWRLDVRPLPRGQVSFGRLAAALAALFAVFEIVLRPGIDFF